MSDTDRRFHVLQLSPHLCFLATVAGRREAMRFLGDWLVAHPGTPSEPVFLVLVNGETFEPVMTSGGTR